MKIYTGSGDAGKTSLFSGERRKKNDLRVATYGMVDELCSFVGAVAAQLPTVEEKEAIVLQLQRIQADLFDIGALLATTSDAGEAGMLKELGPEHARRLEAEIDFMQGRLDELHSFILPGGHPSAAWAHVVRAICRRAEREVVSLEEAEGCLCSGAVITYMNRLSDYFFVLARYINHISGTAEISWYG